MAKLYRSREKKLKYTCPISSNLPILKTEFVHLDMGSSVLKYEVQIYGNLCCYAHAENCGNLVHIIGNPQILHLLENLLYVSVSKNWISRVQLKYESIRRLRNVTEWTTTQRVSVLPQVRFSRMAIQKADYTERWL